MSKIIPLFSLPRWDTLNINNTKLHKNIQSYPLGPVRQKIMNPKSFSFYYSSPIKITSQYSAKPIVSLVQGLGKTLTGALRNKVIDLVYGLYKNIVYTKP